MVPGRQSPDSSCARPLCSWSLRWSPRSSRSFLQQSVAAAGNRGARSRQCRGVRDVRRSSQAGSRPVHDRDLVQADRDRRREHDRHRRDHQPRAAPDPRRRAKPMAQMSTPTGSWASTPPATSSPPISRGSTTRRRPVRTFRSAERPPSPTTCGITPPPPSTGPPGPSISTATSRPAAPPASTRALTRSSRSGSAP